jgi:hypothetical protein
MDLATLFDVFATATSDETRSCAESEILAQINQNLSAFLLGCAAIFGSDSAPVRSIASALVKFNRALTPTCAVSLLGRPNPALLGFADEARNSFKLAILRAVVHPSAGVRTLAAECIPLMVHLTLTDAGDILSELIALFRPDSEDCVRHGAILALKCVYASSVMPQLSCEVGNEILWKHLPQLIDCLWHASGFSQDFIAEVVLAVSCLIHAAPCAFSSSFRQDDLLNLVEQLLLHLSDPRLYQAVHDLLRVDLLEFYDCLEMQPDHLAIIASIGTGSSREDFALISLDWWVGLCQYELDQFRHNQSLRRYHEALNIYCTADGLEACPGHDICPWNMHLERNIGATFVRMRLLPRLFDPHALDSEVMSIAGKIMCTVCSYFPEDVCASASAALSAVSSPSAQLRQVLVHCLNALCRAPGHLTAIAEFIHAQGTFLMESSLSDERSLSDLAVSAIESGIRYHGLWTSERDPFLLIDHLLSLFERGGTDRQCILMCLSAILERIPTDIPESPLPLLLRLMNDATSSLITANVDAEILRSMLKVQEIIVQRLPDDHFAFVRDYLEALLQSMIITSEMPPDLRFPLQQGYLSIITVIFKSRSSALVAEAGEAICLVLELIGAGSIVAVNEVIAALVGIIEILKEDTLQVFEPLKLLVLQAYSASDPQRVAQINPLVVGLVGSVTSELLGDLPAIADTIHSSLRETLSTREFYPNLLLSLASILRAIPVALPEEQLECCFSEFMLAGHQPFDVTIPNEVEIEYVNLLYQSIFSGMGALIFVAHENEAFLTRHYGQWFAHMPRFVEQFGMHASTETLGAYTSFLDDAVTHMPDSCWLEIAQVVVRIPLILGRLATDPHIKERADALWDKMLS